VINTWNSLPEKVVSVASISAVKASLDSYWEDIGYKT